MHLWGAWASTSKIWGFMRGFAKENSFGLGKMGGGELISLSSVLWEKQGTLLTIIILLKTDTWRSLHAVIQ